MMQVDKEVIKVVGTPFAPLTRVWCKHEAECLSKLAELGFANAPKLINLDGNSFTMEMIEGPSLRGNQLVEEDLFLRVQRVVDQLHSLGFAHGNLRPNNILIADEDVPFLIDFETCCLRSNPLFFFAKFSDHVRLHSLWQSRVVKTVQGPAKTRFPRSVTVAMILLAPFNKAIAVVKASRKRLKRPRKVPVEIKNSSPGLEDWQDSVFWTDSSMPGEGRAPADEVTFASRQPTSRAV